MDEKVWVASQYAPQADPDTKQQANIQHNNKVLTETLDGDAVQILAFDSSPPILHVAKDKSQ